MKLYRIELELKSALISRLQSDTIFGQFCWAFRNRFGEGENFKNLLSKDNPVVIFSNGFPSAKLPRPVLLPLSPGQREDIKSRLKDSGKLKTDKHNPDFSAELLLKKLKKKKHVEKELLCSLAGGLNEYKLVKKFVSKLIKKAKDKQIEIDPYEHPPQSVFEYERERNIIDRYSGQTLAKGGLFTVSETRYKKRGFDIYVLFKETDYLGESELKQLITDVFENTGYGADASVGAGHFVIKKIVEENSIPYAPPENTDKDSVMSLSNFVPDENIDFDYLYYKLVSKFGMLGDRFALLKNPYKKPIVMMQAGATFKPERPGRYFGKMLDNIYSNESIGIVQNAFLIPFYFKAEVSGQ